METPIASPVFVTMEAAEYLKISPRLLWELDKNGSIKSVRFTCGSGKRPCVRYRKKDLDEWLERQTNQPVTQDGK